MVGIERTQKSPSGHFATSRAPTASDERLSVLAAHEVDFQALLRPTEELLVMAAFKILLKRCLGVADHATAAL